MTHTTQNEGKKMMDGLCNCECHCGLDTCSVSHDFECNHCINQQNNEEWRVNFRVFMEGKGKTIDPRMREYLLSECEEFIRQQRQEAYDDGYTEGCIETVRNAPWYEQIKKEAVRDCIPFMKKGGYEKAMVYLFNDTSGIKKKCYKCKQEKDLDNFVKNKSKRLGYDNLCLNCQSVVNTEKYNLLREDDEKRKIRFRKDYETIKKNPYRYMKAQARVKVRNAIRYGKLEVEKVCVHCRSTELIQYHHHDYNKPLEIVAVCKYCHESFHSGDPDVKRSVQEALEVYEGK